MTGRESNRIKDAEKKRVLDEAARQRRARKALEALEQDNFHEDPHADLVMSKKVPKFHDGMKNSKEKKAKRKNAEYYKAKYRKTHDTKIPALVARKVRNTVNVRWLIKRGRRRSRTTFKYLYHGKTFSQLLDECKQNFSDEPNYLNALAPPPNKPARRFCAVCGNFSKYNCTACGTHYCCIRCLGTHQDTRCLKWTA